MLHNIGVGVKFLHGNARTVPSLTRTPKPDALLPNQSEPLKRGSCHGDILRGRLAGTYESREGYMSW